MTLYLHSPGKRAAVLCARAALLGSFALAAVTCNTDDRNPVVADVAEGSLEPDQGMDEPLPNEPRNDAQDDEGSNAPGGVSETPDDDLDLVETDPDDSAGNVEPNEPSTPVAREAPNCDPSEGPVPNLQLTEIAADVTQPLFVSGVPGDDSRLFILEKGGAVRILQDGELLQQPFLDISSQVANQGERGLLGLAFHPNYADNGLLYLHYSANDVPGVADGTGILSEFSVSSSNPNSADPNSERQLLAVDQPQSNHNGGMIAFGPDDGFLYVGLGDGGGGNDQHGPIGNGQALDTLLGKLLRIDVDARDVNGAYGIPPQNLAAETGQAALPEIWSYGLRNPWRFSFDACNGDLFVGDVGQSALEEIDYLPAGTSAGANFGWRVMEGTECGPQGANCSADGLVLPIDEYGRGDGVSVTGGYVYRGNRIPGLRGYYVYADYGSANFFLFRVEGGQAVDRQMIRLGDVQAISSFGQDNAGEIYVTSLSAGVVYRLDAN